MPLYEFICTDCNHQFEELKSSNNPELPTCPKCEQSNIKKLVSASSLGKTSSSNSTGNFQAPPCSAGGG